MKKSNPYRKPEEAWKMTEKGIELKYPIFHHDPAIPDDPTIKLTIEDVLGDVDFWTWEGSKEDRIIDSTGKVFMAKFETSKGYTLRFIPTEFQSGLFPGGVEKLMSIEEIKAIMIAGMERNEVRIKENLAELKRAIESMNSIEEVLTRCGKYF